jgi:hypothetical protein
MSATLTLVPSTGTANTAPVDGDFTLEPPPRLSDWVDAGLAQAKEAQRDVVTALDTWAQMLAQSARVSAECQLRIFQMTQANAAASYQLAREILQAHSFARVVEVSTDAARRQAEAAAAQMRELSDLARKAATETTQPLTTNIARALQQAA